MPAGPPNLWALTETRSAPSSPRSTSTCPAAAQASTWTGTPASRHNPTISSTGWRVPVSWLAHWQWTSAGRSPPAAESTGPSAPGSIRPERSTGSSSTGPARAAASRTAECSTAAATIGRPGAADAAPNTAALIASVPPR